ncbi:MAG: hypothetical protein KA821_04560 [Chitinophagaceae bacterium]|nr:hypothetical protein [Chitinophagaceae bacterium]
MPKVDIYIKPGEELPTKMRIFLQEHFSDTDFEKLSKFGGRIQISLAAPFTDRKEQDNTLIIDSFFVDNLKNNLSEIDMKLKILTKKQLVKVAELLNFPTTAKATTKEIKKTIIDFLNSRDKWAKISE